jgi:predicted TPR repeat methyltransferase
VGEPDKAPATPRDMTLEEAIAMAILFQKEGHLDQAAEVYRQIMAAVPEHPDVLHYAGILSHQQERHDEAIALIQRSLALVPDRADCYSNLGIVYKAQGRLEEAASAFDRALALEPRHVNALSNRGVLYRAQGRDEDAEKAYLQAIEIDPDHIDAWHNLGVLFGLQGRTKDAAYCFSKVTTLSPRHPQARRLLALAYCTLGQREKAVEIFEDWLKEEPDNAIARHMLPACSGDAVPDRAADAFVELVFDQFARSFESKLKQLGYRAPRLVHAMLEQSDKPAAKQLDVLDAGCGTGLCGPLVAPYARRLVGVDLSAGMLEQARSKEAYDELVKEELGAFLERHVDAFDVIISADTLCYFGVLDEVVGAAARALRPEGLLIFTVEETSAERAPAGFVLETHGRYSHTEPYLERLLGQAHLAADIARAELRMESGVPVTGLVVRAVKPKGLVRAIYSAELSPGSTAGGGTRTGARDA